MTGLWLRSALFNLGFFGGSALLAVALAPALALPRGVFVRAGRLWARWTDFLLRRVVGAEIVIEGAEKLPAHGCIVAARHQSMWEAVALNSGAVWGRGAFLKRPGRIVLRVLDPIAPGLARAAFMADLERRIETAVTALSDAPSGGA